MPFDPKKTHHKTYPRIMLTKFQDGILGGIYLVGTVQTAQRLEPFSFLPPPSSQGKKWPEAEFLVMVGDHIR